MTDPDYRKFRVLVVEDQPFIRQIVKGILRNLGFGEIREAADGTTALSSVQMNPPDIIVCDIQMEPMGGLEFLSILRGSRSARLKRVPFIFLTALGDETVVREAVGEGVDGYILKPVSQKALEARILSALLAVTRMDKSSSFPN